MKTQTIKIPKFLKRELTTSLIRLGRNNDGGYLTSSEDVKMADLLVSMGINDDWSFEHDFIEINSIPLSAYDGSISGKIFFKHILNSLKKLRINSLLRSIKTYKKYKEFFKGQNIHHELYVTNYTCLQNKKICIKDIFDKYEYCQNIFLKIDIEGFEYRILDEISRNADKICGLIVEFHDCDLHQDRIKNFIEQFPLNLVHVHPNNCSDISPDGVPHVLEISFSRYSKLDQIVFFPHKYDMANTTNKPDIHFIV